jgi:hypothetical protein
MVRLADTGETVSMARITTGDPPVGRAVDVFEIPLVGDGPFRPTQESDDPTPPDYAGGRGPIVVAVIGIAIVALVIWAVTGGSGDDRDLEDPGAAISGESAVAITTPPTLGQLEVLPPATVAQPTVEAPRLADSASAEVFAPTYRDIAEVDLSELLRYDIADAVARLDGIDVPRRSETHLELGIGGYELDATIENDPVNDRYRITVESRVLTEVAIVDIASGTTYIDSGTDANTTVSNDDLLFGTGATDIRDFMDRLMSGPVRPDTFRAAGTRGRGLVEIDDVGVARQFVTNVEGALIPEWQVYVFGPTFEFEPGDRPSELEYFVYVNEAGDIVQVDGVAMLGNVPQLVQHRITTLDEPVEIDLPSESSPNESPPTTSAATTP